MLVLNYFREEFIFYLLIFWFNYTNIPIIIVLAQRLFCSDRELEGKNIYSATFQL